MRNIGDGNTLSSLLAMQPGGEPQREIKSPSQKGAKCFHLLIVRGAAGGLRCGFPARMMEFAIGAGLKDTDRRDRLLDLWRQRPKLARTKQDILMGRLQWGDRTASARIAENWAWRRLSTAQERPTWLHRRKPTTLVEEPVLGSESLLRVSSLDG
jgi:hypothetical protein